jgi:hypothetical protein
MFHIGRFHLGDGTLVLLSVDEGGALYMSVGRKDSPYLSFHGPSITMTGTGLEHLINQAKPRPLENPPTLRGDKTLSDLVIEQRENE